MKDTKASLSPGTQTFTPKLRVGFFDSVRIKMFSNISWLSNRNSEKQILTDIDPTYFRASVEAKDSTSAFEAAGRQRAGGGGAAASGGTGSRLAAAAQR